MRLLTKSKFKLALSCPTKLYYDANPELYPNSKLDDPFLKALAQGGFQVGALAQCYYPEGQLIKTLNKDEALAQTNELLKRENVTIFEAAIWHQNLFVRVDILVKKGKHIQLIEVKSKSVDPALFPDQIWNKNPLKKGIYAMGDKWGDYIYDVAFQAHVAKLAFPTCEIQSFLMCADKTKVATVEGLNQRFFLNADGEVELKGDTTPEGLGAEILTRLDVTDYVSIIHRNLDTSNNFNGLGWEKGIEYLAAQFVENKKIATPVGANCKQCEFSTGFKECWKAAHGLTDEELTAPMVFKVWNLRTADLLAADKLLMDDLDESDFNTAPAEKGLSQGQRQWLQVEKEQQRDKSSYLDRKGLAAEFASFTYPLHMIDFETCMVAIPFNKGTRPYQQIAFQFSHHQIEADGTVTHADDYINTTPGLFPNFIFVRNLKQALSKDQGTIFRYSNHENTVLRQIREQLAASNEPDKDELMEFIDSITDDAPRSMVDLCELGKKYYYSHVTGGSNSIKYVLPAILNESEYLKKKYGQPNYTSKNFKNHQWIKLNPDGSVQDPYKTLEPALSNWDYETLEAVMSQGQDEINNGGAALTAYALMQFAQMSEAEREKIRKALLRYCELDTLAMVMVWEFWNKK